MQNKLDWKIEAEFGFSPFDCRMCYGYERSKSLYNRVKEGKKVKELVAVKEKLKGVKNGAINKHP